MATVECPSCRTTNPSEALYCSACGAAMHRSDGDDMIGKTVGGRYHLVEKIGQGSAGTLYRAEHVTLRRRMAVKLLHKQLALSDEAVERFRREAITVCEIDNDHIPQVHDFGRTDDEQLFFAMEFLDGETLSAVLEREGRVSPERTADVLSQIADGLMEAHTLGYVHRDLRPRSIFLTRRRGRQDFVKILDFGLAKLVQPEVDAQRTAMGMTYGDPRYMAPEQARGEATDRRADIYSLGVLGFEMLVGEPPFKGGGTFEVLQKVLDAPVPRVRERRTDCPPWLESVIRTALAKRPAERFQTVAQLLDALERKQVLPNQPPMPMQLTSQQASKLAGLKDKDAPAPRTGPAPPMQVFVSSPSLRAIPVAGAVPVPATNATQAMPTVAPAPSPRTTVPGQGPVRLPSPAAAAPAPQTPAPRMTMSYPSVKLSRSGTAPGVSEHRPGANPEPPALTGEAKSSANSDMRLLGERLPPAEAKSAPGRAAAAKSAPSVQPAARTAESAPKPSLLIASTTQPRNDPTPRTARAMLQQEALAWEEAALPVLGTTDLTDSASLSEPAGRAPSADTPVEEMKFAPGAASATSPKAEDSAVAPRPISAPAIAAMRSMFPGPGGPKASEQHKAVSAPAAAKSSPALGPVVSATTKSSPAISPTANKSAPALSPVVPAVAKSSPALGLSGAAAGKSSPALSPSASGGQKGSSARQETGSDPRKSSPALGASGSRADDAAKASASASGVSRLAAAGKSSDLATRPLVALSASGNEEGRAGSPITAPLPRLAETATAAAGATAAPVESTPFGVGSGSLSDTEDDADTADATIPHVRSSREDETPIIAHLVASARSPSPASAASPSNGAPPDTVETPAQFAASGEPAGNLPHDTPLDGLPRAAGAESNWFSTPATSAADTFANDDNDVVIGRRRVPRWTLAVGAGALLLLGVVYIASRPSTPSPVVTPPPVVNGPAVVAVPTPVVPVPTPPAAPVEATKTEPPTPGPEVSPLPMATAIPPSAANKPVAGPEASPSGTETKPSNEKPVAIGPEPAVTAPVAKENKPAAVVVTPVPETRPTSEKPEPKAKPAVEAPSVKPGKATAENKTKPAAEKPKTEPESKVVAKAEKVAKEPKVAASEAAPVEKAEKKPGEAGALVQNAKKKLEDGEPDAATALFARAVELDPRSAEAVGGLGESYFEQGNFETAARHLGKAARLAPKRVGYQELLVQALYKVNKFKEAAEACRKLLKLAPSSAKAKQTLELAEKKLGSASN